MILWKRLAAWFLLTQIALSASAPVWAACTTCGGEARVRFQFRGIARIAGHATVEIYVGEDRVSSFVLTGGSVVWDGSRYVAQSFDCVQWPTNVTVEPEL